MHPNAVREEMGDTSLPAGGQRPPWPVSVRLSLVSYRSDAKSERQTVLASAFIPPSSRKGLPPFVHRFGFAGIFAGAGYVLSTGDSRNGSGISTGQSALPFQAILECSDLTHVGSSLVSDLLVPKRPKIILCAPASGSGRPDSRYNWLRWFLRL